LIWNTTEPCFVDTLISTSMIT